MHDVGRSADHAEVVRDYFDAEAERYGHERYGLDPRDCHQYSYLVRREHVLAFLGTGGGRLLDIGCGPGVYTAALLARGYSVWAYDISPRMIDRAKEMFPAEVREGRVRFSVGELEDVDAEDGFFDAVLCVGVLAYVRELGPFLLRVSQLLRPGGRAIVQASKKVSPKAVDEVIVSPLGRRIKRWLTRRAQASHPMVLRRYQLGELDKACSRYGLQPVACAHYDYTLPVLRSIAGDWNLLVAKRLEARSGVLSQWLAGDFVVQYSRRP